MWLRKGEGGGSSIFRNQTHIHTHPSFIQAWLRKGEGGGPQPTFCNQPCIHTGLSFIQVFWGQRPSASSISYEEKNEDHPAHHPEVLGTALEPQRSVKEPSPTLHSLMKYQNNPTP